jgi:SAM-dependent methyltransferase
MLHHLDSESKDALLAKVRRVLRPDGLLILADAIAEEHGHGHQRGRMREQLHDNIGDAVSRTDRRGRLHRRPHHAHDATASRGKDRHRTGPPDAALTRFSPCFCDHPKGRQSRRSVCPGGCRHS